MTKETLVEKPLPIIPILRSDLVGILLLGGAVGLVVWALGMILDRYMFDVYFCQGDVARQCGSAKNYAAAGASLVGAGVALVGLVRLRVYRPLLVVIASTLSTWGVVQISWSFGWFTGILVAFALYALAFAVYSWTSRVREFWIALLIMTALVIVVRLALAV